MLAILRKLVLYGLELPLYKEDRCSLSKTVLSSRTNIRGFQSGYQNARGLKNDLPAEASAKLEVHLVPWPQNTCSGKNSETDKNGFDR